MIPPNPRPLSPTQAEGKGRSGFGQLEWLRERGRFNRVVHSSVFIALVGISAACNSNVIPSTIASKPVITAKAGDSTTAPTALPRQTIDTTPLPAGATRVDAAGVSQVWVPAGCFKMGSDPATDALDVGDSHPEETLGDVHPVHEVCITHGYWLDQFDVTNASFDDFVSEGGEILDKYWSADGLKWKHKENFDQRDNAPACSQQFNDEQQARGARYPRVCVNWFEAEAYANWRTKVAKGAVTYRLPTEAEWEYAARGPQSLVFPWGNTFDGTRLNYCDKNCDDSNLSPVLAGWADKSVDDGYAKTSPVGAYESGKSWVNAYDMAGNVQQWMDDWYDANYYQHSPKNDPAGPTSGNIHGDRVIRGSDWLTSRQVLVLMTPAMRSECVRNCSDDLGMIGFRVVGISTSPNQ